VNTRASQASMDYGGFEREYTSGYSLAEQDRMVDELQSEVFDLKMQMNAQAAELQRLSNAERERAEMEAALLRAEADLEERDMALQSAETKVAILQAEVEQAHSDLEETENLRSSHILARRAEGFRILDSLLSRCRRQFIFEGFFMWRACVIDRAAWRLGMARRAAFAGNTVPPPPRRKAVAVRELGTQTLPSDVKGDSTKHRRSLDEQYHALMREARDSKSTQSSSGTPDAKVQERPKQSSRVLASGNPLDNDKKENQRSDAVRDPARDPEVGPNDSQHMKNESKLTKTEHNFGQNISSIQQAVRGVLSTRKGRQTEKIEKTASASMLSSKEEIRRLLE